MASPFVPVPVPMDRALSVGGSKLRRPHRASSLGSVSSSSEDQGRGCGSQRQSRGVDRGSRSRTPPPLQSPVTRGRVNGTLEPTMEYSSCPRSVSDPSGSQQCDERPITPTVLGYEVMEERAKFTVWFQWWLTVKMWFYMKTDHSTEYITAFVFYRGITSLNFRHYIVTFYIYIYVYVYTTPHSGFFFPGTGVQGPGEEDSRWELGCL